MRACVCVVARGCGRQMKRWRSRGLYLLPHLFLAVMFLPIIWISAIPTPAFVSSRGSWLFSPHGPGVREAPCRLYSSTLSRDIRVQRVVNTPPPLNPYAPNPPYPPSTASPAPRTPTLEDEIGRTREDGRREWEDQATREEEAEEDRGGRSSSEGAWEEGRMAGRKAAGEAPQLKTVRATVLYMSPAW
jgi:hypothetical protein